MQQPIEQLILASARQGILPLTSACNVRCVFCSNRQNPPGVEAYNILPRPLAAVEATLQFMAPSGKIIIGESATRINEGEPFTHPHFQAILAAVRRSFPAVPIQITTNGSLLDEAAAVFLSGLAPVEINLSLNSAKVGNRVRLMDDRAAAAAVRAPATLAAYGIPYHGSIVAMNWLTGWDDMAETVECFDRHQARTVRIFLPGYTRLAPPEMRFPPTFRHELQSQVESLRQHYRVPLLLEPPGLDDLTARVEGVMAGTPAERAGVRTGDIIEQVNGLTVRSRVEAFNLCTAAADPLLQLRRAGRPSRLVLAKERRERPGFVVSYDIDPERCRAVVRAGRKYRAKRVLLLTSALAAPVVSAAMTAETAADFEWRLAVCRNVFFGGSIMAAGLLSVGDFLAAAEAAGREWRPDLLVLPSEPFDERGRDLTGRSYLDLVTATGLPVELV